MVTVPAPATVPGLAAAACCRPPRCRAGTVPGPDAAVRLPGRLPAAAGPDVAVPAIVVPVTASSPTGSGGCLVDGVFGRDGHRRGRVRPPPRTG